MPHEKSKAPHKLDNGTYEVEKRLGAGCFGEVWKAHDTKEKGKQYAVKFEELQAHAPQLEHEKEVLEMLSKPDKQQGFALVYYFGKEQGHSCLVMDLLGKSLEDRMQGCKNKFTPLTTALVAEQILQRIEYLHSRGIIHRDIKPENFMFGVKEKVHHLYLIDFGLSKRYFDGKHIGIRTKLRLTGTARYASINAHRGIEQSRRDDLEAIGHMLFYFLRGSLPWSGLEAKSPEEKYNKIREKKEEIPLDSLCGNHPANFKAFLKEARNLEFKERPDYQSYRKLMRDVRENCKDSKDSIGAAPEDHQFQWFDGKQQTLGDLDPVVYREPRQPDDTVVQPRKFRFFSLCGSKAAKSVSPP